jgi:hypothetical protein
MLDKEITDDMLKGMLNYAPLLLANILKNFLKHEHCKRFMTKEFKRVQTNVMRRSSEILIIYIFYLHILQSESNNGTASQQSKSNNGNASRRPQNNKGNAKGVQYTPEMYMSAAYNEGYKQQ